MKLIILLIYIVVSLNTHSKDVGSETGFKIPRYVSLKFNEVNLRVGSSTNYPIILTYTKKNFPVEIIRELKLWREVVDLKGNKGWIRQNLLQGERFAIIRSKVSEYVKIYSKPKGKEIGKIGNNNIVKINKCILQWCKITHSNKSYWIQSKLLWGVYKNELINIPIYQPLINLYWKLI